MARSANAQTAVDLYTKCQQQHRWTAATAWCGIARLLLSCEVYRTRWQSFYDVVVYADSNRFKAGKRGPHAALCRAERLTNYLAGQLGVDREDLCRSIGTFWQRPEIRALQPHNPAGHAFRSLVANALQMFGDPGITYEEDGDLSAELVSLGNRVESKGRKADVVARRAGRVVATIAVNWRLRHNRLGFLHRSIELAGSLRGYNPHAQAYAVVGEFDGGRLRKLLANCSAAIPNTAVSAAVHFAPELIREGLQENGTLQQLKSLEWLIGETYRWE